MLLDVFDNHKMLSLLLKGLLTKADAPYIVF